MESIYYIGIVQAWFAALLLFRKPNKGTPDKLLIVWLLIIGVEMLYSLLNLKYFTHLPDLIIIPLCYGPFLLFYATSLISKQSDFEIKSYLHFAPFVLFVIVSFFWATPIDIDAVNFLKKGSLTLLAVSNFALFFGSMLFYWIKVFKLIRNHNKTLSDHFSYRSDSIKLTWLKTVALWILGGFIGSAVTFFIFFLQDIFPFNPIEIFHLGLLIFTFSISYYGIHQPVIYQRKPLKNTLEKSTTSAESSNELGSRLKSVMLKSEPYLNNELTIQDLSDLLNESPSSISTYLNKELGVNFFNYINGFRVEKAKELLSNSRNKKETLLAIAFDSGFNSKSSFNLIFKRSTGMTPSEYRKIHCKE
ncbi:MAG TPA: AraC family transcriptional regulator [Tenuifilaceae bacterium]|nr:AraC family transcriptional regulator [Tenuifilaceae bacterium]HPQ34602.1 AraC family transcriptional regulator [Tenuifilaceae bacterium]